MIDVAATFEKYDDEFLRYERIPPDRKPHARPDLCAFLLLDRLVPGDRDMVAAAEHDQIYLAVAMEDLSAVATEEDIVTLARCGVTFDTETGSLAMFV